MIYGKPEVMRLTIDPHKNLVKMPSPLRIRAMMNAPLPDFRDEHRTEPIPLEPHCLVADIDATLRK